MLALALRFQGNDFQTLLSGDLLSGMALGVSSQFSWVQSRSRVWLFVTPRTAAHFSICPSPTPWACSNSCPSSRWCHPISSSSVVPFSCLQSYPASGSFPMSQFFTSGGQSTGVSGGQSICVSSKRSVKRPWLCKTPPPRTDTLSVLVLGSICDPFLSDALLLETQLWRSLPCLSGPKVKVKVAQSCPTLCNPVGCSPPGSSVHGILQTRILEWVTIPFSRGSSQRRDQAQAYHISGRFFTSWATREAPSWPRSRWSWGKCHPESGMKGHTCSSSGKSRCHSVGWGWS